MAMSSLGRLLPMRFLSRRESCSVMKVWSKLLREAAVLLYPSKGKLCLLIAIIATEVSAPCGSYTSAISSVNPSGAVSLNFIYHIPLFIRRPRGAIRGFSHRPARPRRPCCLPTPVPPFRPICLAKLMHSGRRASCRIYLSLSQRFRNGTGLDKTAAAQSLGLGTAICRNKPILRLGSMKCRLHIWVARGPVSSPKLVGIYPEPPLQTPWS